MLQSSGHAVRCFTGGPRKSNESQCPMLQKVEKPILSTATTPSMTPSQRQTIVRNHLNSTCSVTNSPHQKKLRFHLAKERKASTTLGIIMSAFIVCWLPFFVLALVRPFLNDPETIPQFLSSLFLWLGYCNSLLNPIIYATLNRDFRRPFREILFFRCGNLNNIMREEFYYSQYGYPTINHEVNKTVETENTAERHDNQGLVESHAAAPDESFLWSKKHTSFVEDHSNIRRRAPCCIEQLHVAIGLTTVPNEILLWSRWSMKIHGWYLQYFHMCHRQAATGLSISFFLQCKKRVLLQSRSVMISRKIIRFV